MSGRCKPTPLPFDAASLYISPRKLFQAADVLPESGHHAPRHAFSAFPSGRVGLVFQRHGGERAGGRRTCRCSQGPVEGDNES